MSSLRSLVTGAGLGLDVWFWVGVVSFSRGAECVAGYDIGRVGGPWFCGLACCFGVFCWVLAPVFIDFCIWFWKGYVGGVLLFAWHVSVVWRHMVWLVVWFGGVWPVFMV